MAGKVRLELTTFGFGGHCAANCATSLYSVLVVKEGLEPSASAL